MIVNVKKLLQKAEKSPHNLRFSELVRIIESFGFRIDRVSGSHCIFVHPDIPELMNVQDRKGQAKSYQIKQLLSLVEKYKLEQQ